jgi:hypothetical protein
MGLLCEFQSFLFDLAFVHSLYLVVHHCSTNIVKLWQRVQTLPKFLERTISMQDRILLFLVHLRVPSKGRIISANKCIVRVTTPTHNARTILGETAESRQDVKTHVKPVSSGLNIGSQPKSGGPWVGTMVPSVRPSNRTGSEPVEGQIFFGHAFLEESYRVVLP